MCSGTRGFSFENVEHTSTTVINHLEVIICTASPPSPDYVHCNAILSVKVGGHEQVYPCPSRGEGTNFGNKLMQREVLPSAY